MFNAVIDGSRGIAPYLFHFGCNFKNRIFLISNRNFQTVKNRKVCRRNSPKHSGQREIIIQTDFRDGVLPFISIPRNRDFVTFNDKRKPLRDAFIDGDTKLERVKRDIKRGDDALIVKDNAETEADFRIDIDIGQIDSHYREFIQIRMDRFKDHVEGVRALFQIEYTCNVRIKDIDKTIIVHIGKLEIDCFKQSVDVRSQNIAECGMQGLGIYTAQHIRNAIYLFRRLSNGIRQGRPEIIYFTQNILQRTFTYAR